MSQRNNHRRIAESHRLATIAGLLQLRSTLLIGLLALVLLITSGGAG
jgi:hypothetical protein